MTLDTKSLRAIAERYQRDDIKEDLDAQQWGEAMSPHDVLALLDSLDCGGKGCGTDESKACLRCCRILIENGRANHGGWCDREIARLSNLAERALRQLAAVQGARDEACGIASRWCPADVVELVQSLRKVGAHE